jgi:hypothetical protein
VAEVLEGDYFKDDGCPNLVFDQMAVQVLEVMDGSLYKHFSLHT